MTGGFCTICSHHVDTFEGLKSCPNCGCSDPPCDDDKQVNININIHEIRILGIWSENYACQQTSDTKNMKDVVYAILHRIKKQLPKQLATTPLSMSEEFEQLKGLGLKFMTNHIAANTPEMGEHYDPELAGAIDSMLNDGPLTGEDLDDEDEMDEPT